MLKHAQERVTSLHQEKEIEKGTLVSKRDKKRKDIENLSRKEMETLQKYSQSQVAFKEAKTKLDSMLGRIREEKPQKKLLRSLKEG